MIPLVVRSHYSLMWGTTSIRHLCRAARELGYQRLALTDRNNLYGLWPFLQTCEREGITPVVGAEITGPYSEQRASDRRAVLLVKNERGYSNLCRLITHRHQDSDFALEQAVINLHDGLLILTDSPDLLLAWLKAGLDIAAMMAGITNAKAVGAYRAARRLSIPCVAVPDAYFVDPDDYGLHQVLRAISLNTSLSRLAPEDMALPHAWLAGPEEYSRRFEACPEILRASHELAERLEFTGPSNRTVMPPWHDDRGRSASEVLRESAYHGAHGRYGRDLPEGVVNRLEHELNLIERKGFSSYFLVVRDIVKRSPRICGRGSGAASLVAYCLSITNVCPVKHNLYFERFINADRKDPPDIDVDFAWDERDDVIGSVLDEYGSRAAMVSSHILFQPRMAIRETAKVFGLTEREINEKVKRLPWFWRGHSFGTDLRTKLYEMPETRTMEFPEPWPELLSLAQRMVGAPRHLSVHPGGVVIAPDPIENHVPVEIAAKGVPIIQWDKDGAEDGGLVKIDLLGNRSLAVIRDATNNVRANSRRFNEFDWEPEDDPATRAAVARGDTMGCFYIESPATRLLQKKAGKGDFEHLVIHSSIIRPAANEFINEYLRRLKGGAWEPIHPLLGDLLDETYGIMVYQEDVSKAAVALAGFSHAEADGLRKVMSKKDKELALRDYFAQFTRGARARGVTDDQIRRIWDMILSFSGYSFCKPHSASYARVSFQAAYLKVHYPAEFMAAVISNQGGFYSPFAYVSEARRLGITILAPDVNHSGIRYSGRNRTIRVGLMAIKDLGKETRQRIIDEREQSPFNSFEDFSNRVQPAEDEARALIHAGAFDSLASERDSALLLWEMALARASANAPTAVASPGLFDQEPTPPPPIPSGTDLEKLRRQYHVLGFLPDRHPMVLFENVLPKNRVRAADLHHYAGRRANVAGWLLVGKLVQTKTGDPMQFLTFEDETGLVETTFFPKAYERFCRILEWGKPHILGGRVECHHGAITLTVDYVRTVGRP